MINNGENVIAVAYPFDLRVSEKEKENIEKYQEVSRIYEWRKVITIPFFIETLGPVSK